MAMAALEVVLVAWALVVVGMEALVMVAWVVGVRVVVAVEMEPVAMVAMVAMVGVVLAGGVAVVMVAEGLGLGWVATAMEGWVVVGRVGSPACRCMVPS